MCTLDKASGSHVSSFKRSGNALNDEKYSESDGTTVVTVAIMARRVASVTKHLRRELSEELIRTISRMNRSQRKAVIAALKKQDT